MKKYKHGMVLGKFYPPHLGHFYLIDTAIAECNTVTVFVCSLPTESIPGELRYYWIKSHYMNNVKVRIILIDEILPQTPEEHGDKDDFYRIYRNLIHKYANNLDVLFTSEDYGDEFGRYLGIPHKLVDLKRTKYSVSGTDIRSNPVKYWEYIPGNVRPYFKKKIVVLGPESTGKSTLVKKLTDYFNGDIISEYGRDYTDNIPAKTMTKSDFESIAVGHAFLIKTAFLRESGKPYIFIDTDAITTKLFGEMYLGDIFNSDIIDQIIAKQKFDLVLLCDIDVPWVDDGTRDFPNILERKRHFDKIKKELESRKIEYKLIIGDYTSRFNLAKN